MILIVGPDTAGKSTIFKKLTLLMDPNPGEWKQTTQCETGDFIKGNGIKVIDTPGLRP